MVLIIETLNIGLIKVNLKYSYSFSGCSFFGSEQEYLFGFQTGDSNLISISVLTKTKSSKPRV